MGYSTDFDGHFEVTPELKLTHHNYLTNFSSSRRMKRDAEKAKQHSDNTRVNAGLPIGEEGAYCVVEVRDSVTDINHPPEGQPGLWCQWVPSEDGTRIEWDGGEKFYNYEEWIAYLIEHFLAPWGYKLNGTVKWEDDYGEKGSIVVTDNKIEIYHDGSLVRTVDAPVMAAPEPTKTSASVTDEPTLLDESFDFEN